MICSSLCVYMCFCAWVWAHECRYLRCPEKVILWSWSCKQSWATQCRYWEPNLVLCKSSALLSCYTISSTLDLRLRKWKAFHVFALGNLANLELRLFWKYSKVFYLFPLVTFNNFCVSVFVLWSTCLWIFDNFLFWWWWVINIPNYWAYDLRCFLFKKWSIFISSNESHYHSFSSLIWDSYNWYLHIKNHFSHKVCTDKQICRYSHTCNSSTWEGWSRIATSLRPPWPGYWALVFTELE